MIELKNIMENEGYNSIQEIPMDIIELKAYGTIGEDMAQKYVQFLKTFKSDFIPSEVLDNTNYSIPTDMKCSEVIHRLKKYIDLEFSKDKLPTDEQMENMFNTIENTYNPSKDNYVRPLYISIFNKFDFFDSDDKKKSVPGTIVKNAVKVIPAFIPYVSPVYLGLRVGLNTIDLMAKLGKVFTGSDSPTLSALEGFSESLSFSTSDYAKGSSEAEIPAHAWSMENLINMGADTFTQLAE